MEKLLRLVGLTILSTCMLVAGRAAAQVSQNGPYYANPSWDQQLPASTRFVVLTNWGSQAVLDRETGLVWELTPSTNQSEAVSWVGALFNCREFPIAGRFGWRLPTEEELATLLDPQSNSLPVGNPFQGVAARDTFWTASTLEGASNQAYTITVEPPISIFTVQEDIKTAVHQVWCVRGAPALRTPNDVTPRNTPAQARRAPGLRSGGREPDRFGRLAPSRPPSALSIVVFGSCRCWRSDTTRLANGPLKRSAVYGFGPRSTGPLNKDRAEKRSLRNQRARPFDQCSQ